MLVEQLVQVLVSPAQPLAVLALASAEATQGRNWSHSVGRRAGTGGGSGSARTCMPCVRRIRFTCSSSPRSRSRKALFPMPGVSAVAWWRRGAVAHSAPLLVPQHALRVDQVLGRVLHHVQALVKGPVPDLWCREGGRVRHRGGSTVGPWTHPLARCPRAGHRRHVTTAGPRRPAGRETTGWRRAAAGSGDAAAQRWTPQRAPSLRVAHSSARTSRMIASTLSFSSLRRLATADGLQKLKSGAAPSGADTRADPASPPSPSRAMARTSPPRHRRERAGPWSRGRSSTAWWQFRSRASRSRGCRVREHAEAPRRPGSVRRRVCAARAPIPLGRILLCVAAPCGRGPAAFVRWLHAARRAMWQRAETPTARRSDANSRRARHARVDFPR